MGAAVIPSGSYSIMYRCTWPSCRAIALAICAQCLRNINTASKLSVSMHAASNSCGLAWPDTSLASAIAQRSARSCAIAEAKEHTAH